MIAFLRRHFLHILFYYVALPVGVALLLPPIIGWNEVTRGDHVVTIGLGLFTVALLDLREWVLDTFFPPAELGD